MTPDELNRAADEFDNLAAAYDKWYMAKERVSMAMIVDREDYLARCRWAAGELRTIALKQHHE